MNKNNKNKNWEMPGLDSTAGIGSLGSQAVFPEDMTSAERGRTCELGVRVGSAPWLSAGVVQS